IIDAPDAGTRYAAPEGGTVAVNGTYTFGSGAPVAAYQWDFYYDGSTFVVDATGASPTFSAANIDGPATRIVAVRAEDGAGDFSPIGLATISVTNVGPAATIGAPDPVTAGFAAA